MRHKMHEEAVADMIGRKFNRWTVLSHVNREKGYLCRCACGTEKPVRTWSLKSGRSQSCGCLDKEVGRPATRKPNNYSAKRELYKNYKGAAKRRGYKFSLSFKQFTNITQQPCNYCGNLNTLTSPLKAHKDYKYNGIDRVDNTLGYEKSNVVPCCNICNNSKACLSFEQWSDWLNRILKFKRKHVGAWVKH